MWGDLPGALSKRCHTVGRQIWSPLSKPHHSVNRSSGSQEVRRVPNKRWRHSALWPQWRKLGGNKPQGPPAAPIFPSHSHPDNEFPEELGSATCQRHRPQRMVGLGHGNGRSTYSCARISTPWHSDCIVALLSINILPWINICTIPLCVVSPW